VKAFISYARADGAFALRLAADLRAAGVAAWVDQLDIPKGKFWDREIEKALAACTHVVVILSPAAIASDNVMDEAYFGLEERKTVIPALHEACSTPYRLRRLQHIDFTQDYASGLGSLTQALLAGAEPQAATPPASVPSPEAKRIRGSGVTVFEALRAGRQPRRSEDPAACIAAYIHERFQREEGIDLRLDILAVRRVEDAAAKAAADLSAAQQTEINLPYITANESGPKHFYLKLSRQKLQSLTSSRKPGA